MMNAMQSSPEEFMLVLNRWKTDSALVKVAASFTLEGNFASVTMLEGRLEVDPSAETLQVVSSDGSMFTVGYAGAVVGYGTPSDFGSEVGFLIESPEKVEDFLIIRHSSSTILLFSMKPTQTGL